MKRIFLLSVILCFTVMSFAQKDKLTTTNTSTTPVDKPVLNRIPIKTKQGEDKDAMQMEMTDKAKLAAIEKNIYDLTKQVQGLQNKLSATENKLNATENKLSATENKLSATENKLSNAEKKYSTFQVTAIKGNMMEIGIRLDNAACDGNPAALILITRQKHAVDNVWGENAKLENGGGTLYAVYSKKTNKWYIKQYEWAPTGFSGGGLGKIMAGDRTNFNEGDVFNVFVSK